MMCIVVASMTKRNGLNANKRYRTKAGDESLDELREMVQKVCGDPLMGMAMFAAGDVVGLGFMTQAELDAPARAARVSGNAVLPRVPSGKERALEYISPHTRYNAYCELAQYIYAKKKMVEMKAAPSSTEGGGKGGVVIFLPDNGRDTPQVKK
jgi:hypothetical protein